MITALLSTFAIALLLPLNHAQVPLETVNLQGCVPSGELDADIDYFPNKYTPSFSYVYSDIDIFGNKFSPDNTTDLLEITYHKTYKIVTNKLVKKSYLLYQCGTEPPQDEVDSGRHHLILSIPHTGGVAITETPQIPYIELLGKRTEIVAYIGNPSFVASPCMLHMMEENTIETIFNPEDPYNATNNALLTAAFLEENPEAIIFGGPFGDKDGDRVLSVAATQERTNVATFDWIALYAALYNLEGMSNEIISQSQASYDCSSSNAASLSFAKKRRLEESPVILWAQYFQGYNWSVAECPTWDSVYYCEYAKHCGTTIISRPEGVGSNVSNYWYLNDEELLELGKDADVWIYASSTWDTVYEQKKELMDQFKAVQNEAVYDTQGQGSNAWYEQRYAEYDVVGLDMCELVGLGNPNGVPHERRWFRNVYTEPVGQLEQCNIPYEISQPYVPRGAQCTPLTSGVGAVSTVSVLVAAVIFVLLG